MKAKTIFTVVILAFVAVAVGYLVVKEVRAARAPEVAAAGPSDAAPVAAGERGPGTGGPETPTATTPAYGDGASEEGTSPAAPERKVVVTYYYTSKR